MRIILTILVPLTIPMIASASSQCPWLTPGSAAVILGGEVTSVVQGADQSAGSCHFTRRQNAATYQLGIYVAQQGLLACPPASEKLVGIGTGAVQCNVTHSSTDFTEQIDGQVRDVRFTAILATKGIKLTTAQRQSQSEALRRAAEQIAGNLF